MKTIKESSYTIFGMGNIGKILVKRLVEIGVPVQQLVIADIDAARVASVVEQYGVSSTEITSGDISAADIIILATPPKTIMEILKGISGRLQAGQVIISMAAAVSLVRMRSIVRQDVSIVRILPNPPSLISQGMNPVAFEPSTPENVKTLVHSFLKLLGKTVELNDSQMAWGVGLAGAAMRSVLPVLEGMTRAGLEAGLTEMDARRVAAQIMVGTAALALETDLSLDQIRALTPMDTLDDKLVSGLFLETARQTQQKVEAIQVKLMEQ